MKSIIVDKYFSRVQSTLSNQKNVQTVINLIGKYIDKNTDRLTTAGPVKRTVFSDGDRQPFFDLVGIDKDEFRKVIKSSPELSRGVNTSDTFNVLLALFIRYFRLKKMEKERRACAVYMVLSMYPSVFTKYFKFEPNENIMAATLASMSSKFKIKQHPTLLSALADTVYVADDHYAKDIERGSDADLAKFIAAVKTRINSFMKNITNEFMKNHQKKTFLNYEDDNNDPDNFSVADNNSLVIQRITQAVTLQLSVHGPDMKCVTLAAKMNKVSVNDLRSAIVNLCKDKENRAEIEKVIHHILYEFLFDGEHSAEEIRSMTFTKYGIMTYKKSNVTSSNIMEIKALLDKWLSKYSERYKKTNMASTINLFRKAMYMFLIFTIQRTRI